MKSRTSTVNEKNLIKKYPLFAFFVQADVFFFLALLVIGGIFIGNWKSVLDAQ